MKKSLQENKYMLEDHHDSFKYLSNESLCPDFTKRTEIDLERSCAINFFPENRFLPPSKFENNYQEKVASGYRKMRRRRVVIAGLARNLSAILPSSIARIEKLGSMFRDYRVVIYENDSQDDTRNQLRQWSLSNRKIKLLSETLGDPLNQPIRCPQRGERMARYRNQYLDYIAENYYYFDEVIVADLDLAGGWSYDGIANTHGHANWDFVGSYGIIYRRNGWDINHFVQYDAWAFRLNDGFKPLSTEEVNNTHWPRGAPLVPVTSCFGGLGIYRTPALLTARYHGGDCEHIALHHGMRTNGFLRLFINPSQITLYGRRLRKYDKSIARIQRALALLRFSAAPIWL